MLIIQISVDSVLLNKDMAGVASRNQAYPTASQGMAIPTEFLFHTYSDGVCENFLFDEYWKLNNNDNELITIEIDVAWNVPENFTRLREFKCVDGVVEMQDRDHGNPEVQIRSWWTSSRWKQLVNGECSPSPPSRSFRLVPAFPKEFYTHLYPCTHDFEEVEIIRYDGFWCNEDHPHQTIETRLLPKAGPSFCMDVTNSIGQRYNQHFECIDHALVEKYSHDYHDCGGTDMPHEVFWTYESWKQWVSGECIGYNRLFSMKAAKPLFGPSIIAEMEKTECGNPMAELSIWSDSTCQEDLWEIQEFVSKVSTDTDCVHVTAQTKRTSQKHCVTVGNRVRMSMFDSRDCTGASSSSAYIDYNSYMLFIHGVCVQGVNFDNSAKYFKLRNGKFDKFFPLPKLEACKEQPEHPPFNPFDVGPDAHFQELSR